MRDAGCECAPTHPASRIPPPVIFAPMLSVTFLGTSAARPTVERNVSAMALMREGEMLLFECGEGTQRQMMRYGVSFALSEIFFTHFHADHFLGVIGLIRTLGLQGRPERSDQSNDAEEVIGMKVGKEDLGKREAHPIAHHLALGPLTALEEQRFAFAVNGEAGNVAFDCGPCGGRAEEG